MGKLDVTENVSFISFQRTFQLFSPKFCNRTEKRHDFVFLRVKPLSEEVRGSVDVIRESENEGTSDQ